MAKFRDCKFEVTAEQIAFGAVAGAGIGLLALGVKKLFNAKNMKASRDYMKEYPIESDLDDEEYDMEATEACVADFDKWWKMDLCQGLFTITFGSLLAAFGVTMLTPGRKYIVDSSVAKKVTELDIPEKLSDVSDKLGDVSEKLSADVEVKISDVKDKLSEVQLMSRIREADLSSKLKKVQKLAKKIEIMKAISEKLGEAAEKLKA